MYNAIISIVSEIKPHSNADRLELAIVRGTQVVVGKDNFKVGDLCILFPVDGILSPEYCEANNLYAGKDEQGNHTGGYFKRNKARVVAQNFRREKSEGYVAPLSSLDFVKPNKSEFVDGFAFSEINGITICTKYINPATLRRMKERRSSAKRGETEMFRKHFDTPQLKFYIDNIPENTYVYVTEKCHGTSQRYGYVLEQQEVPLSKTMKVIDRVLRWFGKSVSKKVNSAWTHLNGTRNVILEEGKAGFYGDSEGFRWEVIKPFEGNLRKGETIFFEVVGFCNSSTSIMPRVETDILKDKKIITQYGPEMVYYYGTNPEIPGREFDVYVYRITITTEDGHSIDLPWNSVKKRCEELGVKHVPELAKLHYDGNKEVLMGLVDELLEGPSTIDRRHIREGVCLRVDGLEKAQIYKAKSFTFGVLEGYIKDREDVVDMEESS
jgi:RNA ligase (TIGR02306 family)